MTKKVQQLLAYMKLDRQKMIDGPKFDLDGQLVEKHCHHHCNDSHPDDHSRKSSCKSGEYHARIKLNAEA